MGSRDSASPLAATDSHWRGTVRWL